MPPSLSPLGDNAILIDYGNVINEDINKIVVERFHQLQKDTLPGMLEAIPAYSSLAVYYDLYAIRKMAGKGTVYEWMKQKTEEWLRSPVENKRGSERKIRIPVLYDGKDMRSVMDTTGLKAEDIIRIHTADSYRVYMLGFLPGFSYMGELDERLFTKRKAQPEIVEAGSVAITGKQTGVYPLVSPGGWSVIGRTPMKLFDADAEKPVLLNAGDQVAFYSITRDEFNSILTNEHNNS